MLDHLADLISISFNYVNKGVNYLNNQLSVLLVAHSENMIYHSAEHHLPQINASQVLWMFFDQLQLESFFCNFLFISKHLRQEVFVKNIFVNLFQVVNNPWRFLLPGVALRMHFDHACECYFKHFEEELRDQYVVLRDFSGELPL